MKIVFKEAWTIKIDKRTSKTFPEGWSGDLDDDIAELAIKDGVTDEVAPPDAVKEEKAKKSVTQKAKEALGLGGSEGSAPA